MLRKIMRPAIAACILSACLEPNLHALGPASKSELAVSFNHHIRPIFSEHCYACHGPDGGKRKAGLRLDSEEIAFQELKSGDHAIVPGDLKNSALVARIHSSDPDEQMPPPKAGKPLSKEQIDLLTRWVQQGAKWQKHWAFIPPERAPLPAVKDTKWPRNAIDHFILARLEKEGLKPNPEADRVTLLRRVSLDLTGLPPSIVEVDAFLADKSANAYEKIVDRLLQSPHYGERMAQHWLDLARYADTAGYHFDGIRFMWLWRDWVIKAFNNNKPFDQFAVEQLAGDLLPNATQAQRIATGFMRNNMTNDEGGADPDEYLDKYVADRVNTFGSVFLGLTVACCECHDHKFDPIKTKEYYQLYAFFHNVPEKGLDRIRTDNPPPRLPVPTPEQAVKFVEADFRLKDAEKTLQDRSNELGESQEKWERITKAQKPAKPNDEGMVALIELNGDFSVKGAHTHEGQFITTNKTEFVEGRTDKALSFDGSSHAEFGQLVSFDRTNSFSYGAWVKPENKNGCILSKMEKEPGYRGFDLLMSDSRVEVHVVNQWPDDALKVRTRESFPPKQWLHVFATYDGSSKAAGIKLYVNGKLRDVEVEKDKLTNSIVNSEPLRIGSRNAQYSFTGLIEDVRFYDRAISSDTVRLLVFDDFMPIIAKSRGHRSNEERDELAQFYKESYAVDYLRSEADLAKARKQKDEFYTKIPTSLIMEDMTPGRDTFVLVRGDFRNPGERVQEGTPACLPPFPEGPTNRLTLARWLVAPENPLPARVAVNRYWGIFFGTGLVKTENDFGSQGEWPSHPQLLDWLAVQFRDGGESKHQAASAWNVKEIVRLMVTSAAYRQSARVSKEKLERDPYNRLFSRGPRMRLDAEFIRDNALAVSGLLNPKIGGPSVKPYQPAGIWDGVDAKYEQDHGDLLYRRGMYVFWRRSAHYPSFATFDAPNREVCTVYRQTTQTPLQSLVLMNDPVFVEAARGLAQRVLKEEPSDAQKRLVLEFRHTLGRMPKPDEIALLQKTYREQHANFQADPKGAEEFLKIGELKRPEKVDAVELAALTSVANVLLNLDETITK